MIQAHRFWANFEHKSILIRKSHGRDFIKIEDLEVIFPTKKEAHYSGVPTSRYEFSSTCAQSWRKLKIQTRIFWANFKHKSVLIRNSHGCDFYIDWRSRSYISNKKRSSLFRRSYSTLWIFFHMCAKLKKAENSSTQILSWLWRQICINP